MALTVERCCDLAAGEIARMAEVTDGVDPATPVPTCGDWTVADLLQHAGTVYRWAASMVRDSAQERYGREQMDWSPPSDPAAYPAWIADGADFVVGTFRACDPAMPMWAWGWPKTAGFWPRRMVHELAVHRADAELALGIEPAFDPEVAADGVSELLDNLPHATYFAPNVEKLRGDGEVLALVATDAGVTWRVELLPDRFAWEIGGGDDATTTVTGTAADLLLALYGRGDDVEVAGDQALWQHWRTNSAL